MAENDEDSIDELDKFAEIDLDKLDNEAQKRFAKYFYAQLGNISIACTLSGIARQTFYNWMSNSEAFAQVVDDVREKTIDYVESKLMKNIKEGKETSAIFFLKTQGKSRGYVERSEHIIKPGLDDMSDNELDDEIKRLESERKIKVSESTSGKRGKNSKG